MREAGSTDDSAAISQKPSESSISIAVDDQDSNTNLAGEEPSDRSERSFLRRFWCVIPLICAIEIVIVILGVIFLGIPLLLYVFPELFTMMFFQSFRRHPHVNYMNMSINHVKSAGREFYLEGEAGRIGVWHILPRSLSANYKSGVKILDTDRLESYLALTNYPVIVYFHGNSYDRATQQRIAMYNVFSDLNYHVITFDYRGFGDSDGPATEEGLVKDCHLVYNYVKNHSEHNTVIIWGHSLGTAFATKTAMDLSIAGIPPHGLVLESPFNNIRDVLFTRWISLPFFWIPRVIFIDVYTRRLNTIGSTFLESEERIKKVTCPILILHAADDVTVPVKLGRKLRDSALEAGRNVKYVEFEAERRLGHKYIYLAKEMSTIIPDFVSRATLLHNSTSSAPAA
ncbi:hypothetical protein Q1695_004468 [Nippostrongylus brasiliensis]|nr:hypothetical protein Q1695_004468 [Nippostrongylus brasiliensis]